MSSDQAEAAAAPPSATWTREEIASAFEKYQAAATHAGATKDWEPWLECFTEDCRYNEHLYGVMEGRDAVRKWIVSIMVDQYPGNEMDYFPIEWSVIDAEQGLVVCQVWNRMRDPGDGSIFQEYNITILRYAGNGMFASEEDVYNPHHFGVMLAGWEQRLAELAEA